MVADMKPNKKVKTIAADLFIGQKMHYFSCFYITILFQSAYGDKAKRDIIFYL